MISRGSLGRPWIFEEIAKDSFSISKKEKLEIILEHLALEIEEKGEYTAIRELRKHLVWYVKGVRNAASLRNRALTIENRSGLEEFLKELLTRFKEA